MGFSTEIKKQAFIASARRCCICKEFKGRNFEVHHIIHANNGGEDTFENAIPLCFDCHANAGHYNSKHPRGAKFSPEELRKHRDLWYELVKNGKFSLNNIEITQQFFITNSFDIVSEIVNGDFSRFPINEVKLYQNELFHFLRGIEVFSKRGSDYYNHYKSVEEYIVKFPEAKLHTEEYGATFWTRIPTIEELKEKFNYSEFVVNYMLANNAKAEDISRVVFTEYGCADCNYERYEIKEAKVVFLSIFNASENPLSICNITECFIDDGGFVPLNTVTENFQDRDINNLLLESGKCLLIPYCILLTNLDGSFIPKANITYNHIDTGQRQDVRPVELINGYENLTIGPRNFVSNIEIQSDGFMTDYEIKSLDIKNLLLISRFWECGSCPHLFGSKDNSKNWEYICEVFSDRPGELQKFIIKPRNEKFTHLKIVELENEITQLETIQINTTKMLESLILKKGDEYILDVKDADIVEITGYFSLIENEKYVKDISMKRQKITHYIADN